MDDHLSTTQVGWLLGRSSDCVRQMIREGAIEAGRIPSGFRIPRDEVLRVSREAIEEKAGRRVSDTELVRLIDEVLATNSERANPPVRLVRRQRKTVRVHADRFACRRDRPVTFDACPPATADSRYST